MKKLFLLIPAIIFLFASCTKPKATPRPVGYFRINFPNKHYIVFEPDTCPYSFELPDYYKITKANDVPDSVFCWITLKVPKLKAEISITYYQIHDNLEQLIDDSYTLAYKHSIRADDIYEKEFVNDQSKVYATVFDIKGNAASPMQFHITDSTKHFFRGSLYFRTRPNRDSLQPAIDFIEKDIIHLIETFRWK